MTSKDLIGSTLGTCTLEQLVGQGGMGAVYLARQARPARHVAVKVLLPNVPMDSKEYQGFLLRFQREADVIARLEHINIMPIYEYGEHDGLAFLVMPYLTGGSLRERMIQRGPLPLQEVATYMDQAAAALDYAHAQGVVHRDIKPSNFLFHADGRLVLADFGIARIMQHTSNTDASTLTTAGMFLGTPEYMAPEMARGEETDARADIYEMGIMLFQMVSGQSPFKGDSPLVMAVKHLQDALPSLHQMNPAIPGAVDAVVQRATAKRREDRYPSVGALAQEFRIAITPPSYPAEHEARYSPNILPSQAHRPLWMESMYETKPEEYVMDRAHTAPPLPTRQGYNPISGDSPLTPRFEQPITPEPQSIDPLPARRARRPWLPVLITLLVLALLTGGVIVGLQFAGVFGTNHTVSITPTSTAQQNTATPGPTVTTTPSNVQQSQALVQQYFGYINNADYQDAYTIWGTAYHSSVSENKFAAGYANTVHDDVTFDSVIPLPDGTIQVSVTIHTTETTGKKTFQGYYIVGQENGSLHFLSASFSQTS